MIIMEIIFAVIALVAIVISVWLYVRLRGGEMTLENERQRAEALQAKVELLDGRVDALTGDNRALVSHNEILRERLDVQKGEVEATRRDMALAFENTVNRVLEEKSVKMGQMNTEKIAEVLRPLGESIKDFKQKVGENLTEETKQRTTLKTQIENLVNQAKFVGDKAENLARALTDKSKLRGNWGEMLLESTLTAAGLVKGVNYEVQTTVNDGECGRGFTDVIVNLPDGRKIVVDSKVSLNDYEKASSAKDEGEIKQFMDAHVRAVKGHIDSLASKQYHKKVVDAVEFTIMFVPIEPAYMAALDKDGGLWHYAYGKNIMLVSPSNLLPCLHIVKDLWHRDKLSREAANIAIRGERLYDKVRGFVESFYAVGVGLEKAQGEFDKAKGQLETGAGNITSQANELRKLVGSNKQIKGAPDADLGEEV